MFNFLLDRYNNIELSIVEQDLVKNIKDLEEKKFDDMIDIYEEDYLQVLITTFDLYKENNMLQFVLFPDSLNNMFKSLIVEKELNDTVIINKLDFEKIFDFDNIQNNNRVIDNFESKNIINLKQTEKDSVQVEQNEIVYDVKKQEDEIILNKTINEGNNNELLNQGEIIANTELEQQILKGGDEVEQKKYYIEVDSNEKMNEYNKVSEILQKSNMVMHTDYCAYMTLYVNEMFIKEIRPPNRNVFMEFLQYLSTKLKEYAFININNENKRMNMKVFLNYIYDLNDYNLEIFYFNKFKLKKLVIGDRNNKFQIILYNHHVEPVVTQKVMLQNIDDKIIRDIINNMKLKRINYKIEEII